MHEIALSVAISACIQCAYLTCIRDECMRAVHATKYVCIYIATRIYSYFLLDNPSMCSLSC